MKKSVLIPWRDYQKMIRKKSKDMEPATVYTDQRILETLPSRIQQKGKSLLNFIHNMSDLSWDSKGTVTIKNNVIIGSNICDLMKTVLCPYYKDYKAKGFDIFLALLKENNVPETLIQNKCRFSESGQSTQSTESKSSWITY